jgi:curved DNA-binding protein CbpA
LKTIAKNEPVADAHTQHASAHYLELERLLDQIERSTLYYQVLSVDRSASLDAIKLAYQRIISALFPPYKISAGIPEQMLSRMERAFERVSRAFSSLALARRRAEYDSVLMNRPAESLSSPPSQIVSAEPDKTKRQPGKASSPDGNRRRGERFKLALPVHITGYARRTGKWQEMAETINVSRSGITLRLRRRVQHGNVLYVTLPMPEKLRAHNYAAPSYNNYALVRRVGRIKDGAREIGLEFLGEHPPAGYLEKPWALFQTKPWAGADRRRKLRQARAEVVSIEYFNEAMQLIAKGSARTENISSAGLRVIVRDAPYEFELARLASPARGFESFAILCNRSSGKDGFERLSLAFVDSQWPI